MRDMKGREEKKKCWNGKIVRKGRRSIKER